MIKTKGKVIFIDEVHPILNEMLHAQNFECINHTQTPKDQILKELKQYFGIVIRSRFKITAEILDLCPNLKFIARSGSGLENINVDYAKKKGVLCFNSPEGNRDAVAEHAIGMLLCLFNKIHTSNSEVKKGIWIREENRGVELKNKTVGIIGFGIMGQAFAKRLAGFDVKIIAYDKFKKGFGTEQVKEVSLEELKKTSDVVSLHVNYLPENEYLFDAKFISEFKKNIYLINTARGKCVKTADLNTALETGKVLGACLDVIEFESVSFENLNINQETLSKLLSFTNVIVTPHIAGWTQESYLKLSSFLGEKIEASF